MSLQILNEIRTCDVGQTVEQKMRSLLEFIFVHVLVLFSAYLCACFIDTRIRMKCNERTQINPNKQKQIRINLQKTELHKLVSNKNEVERIILLI